MNHSSAPSIIKEVLDIAPEAWLFGATLLGAVREGKIIAWDRDVDLGIPSDRVSLEVIDRFRDAGFDVSGVYFLDLPEMVPYIGEEAIGRIGKFILRKAGVKVEMCCFTPGINGRLYYSSGTPRFLILPEECVYPQKKIPFYHFEANIPERAEDQLAFVYGADWRTPKPNWYFTAEHYLRREHFILELRSDDGSRWSKWTGRKVIEQAWGPQEWSDINTPPDRLLIKEI